jgi:hypothetical protein
LRLSEAILKGARLKGQTRGRLRDRRRLATCALGAAADALGAWEAGLPEHDPIGIRHRLRELFPVLTERTGPGGETVEQAIAALNDHAGWSRERIAVRVAEWEVAFGYAPAEPAPSVSEVTAGAAPTIGEVRAA